MTNLSDLFDNVEFQRMIVDGFVRVQHHPTLDLHIANYTEKAQFAREWNPVTLACRGLIYDGDRRVVARPYGKFFNYGDEAAGKISLTAPVTVTDKLDGSLGISYPTPDGPAIATRGSFTSDQALHATALLRERYPHWRPLDGYTFLFEILYPENRIVLDYAGMDDLVLHGLVSIDSGLPITAGRCDGWDGPIVDVMPYATLGEALEAEPRANAEGFVVRFRWGQMVKVKQDDYVALHRIITGLNARTVWEWLAAGKPLAELCEPLPDEFHDWVRTIAAELQEARDKITWRAYSTYSERPITAERRVFAEWAQQQDDLAPYLFALLDGQDERVQTAAWRAVKPSGAQSMTSHSEAAA